MLLSSHAPGAAALRVARILTALFLTLLAVPAAAQAPVTLTGTVVTASGTPVADAVVAAGTRGTTTDARGAFSLTGLAAGTTTTLRVNRMGYATAERAVTLAADAAPLRIVLTEQAVELAGVVVSATGEAQLVAETPVAVGTVSAAEIRAVRPRHPSELMGHIAGVWVSQTSGEGHTTAIRQPKSTKPMYLFLEDGVPTRSTGFFNHNALYEVNVPQAERVEVLKGPGTALYGSDAIGGVVNVETRRASLTPQAEGSLERGSSGWTRLLLGGSGTARGNGLRADLNVTSSDGFRSATAYDRVSGTLRWDAYLPGNATLRTVAAYSAIEQGEGSALAREDYDSNPELNYNPIAFRRIRAFRLSSALEAPLGTGSVSVTPFVRDNSMEILPYWMLAFDPVIYETGHRSLGALTRVRQELPFWSATVSGGVDLEYSPGYREERTIATTRSGREFVSYTEGSLAYDYDVAFRGVSPYLQAELSPVDRLRLSLGLRYDHVGYAYDTHLDPIATGRWRRPADATVWYDHLSPKLGATYNLSPALGVFASYRHGFRAPAEGQLFRQGSSANGIDLEPVLADSYEGGVRGVIAEHFSYELSAYRMEIADDILTYVERVGGVFNRVNVNAGRTRHEGIELAAGVGLGAGLRVDGSYTNALHTYRDWSPNQAESFDGKRIESAPRVMSDLRLSWAPRFAPDARLGLEWSRVGAYYMDPANAHEYPGHDLLGLRLNLPLRAGLELDASVVNLLDERYAESAAYNAAEGETFTPGTPRSLNLAVQYRWER